MTQAWMAPLPKGFATQVFLPNHWFIVTRSKDVRDRPVTAQLFGTPIVLFRDQNNTVNALLDRCPHRNVPLSLGDVCEDGTLRCAYHGWRFDGHGQCRFIPTRTEQQVQPSHHAVAYPACDQDGFVWVYTLDLNNPVVPKTRPHIFKLLGHPGYTSVRETVFVDGDLYAALENALDVPHTAFLHRGLFRSQHRGLLIKARIHRQSNRVDAEYVGEPRPAGWVAKILAPGGGPVVHFDRFILPSVAQVEYRLGSANHMMIESFMTPLDEKRTRIDAVVSFSVRMPHFLVKLLLRPFAMKLFEQDAKILKHQYESIDRFGGEQFASTEVDVLGKHILRLLKAAERGQLDTAEEHAEVALMI